jgi:hypothetical protein
VTLVVAAGSTQGVGRALAAAPHLAAHEIRAAADSDPHGSGSMAVRTGVPELDHGVAWAAARVRLGLARDTAMPPEAAFWGGLGALALGDAESGRAAMALLDGHDDGPVPWGPAAPASTHVLSVLLAARHTLVTGDARPAQNALARVGEGALEARRAVCGSAGWAVWSLALSTLADALRHAASDAEIESIRKIAALPAGVVGRRLPMVGGPPADPGVAMVRRLFGTGVGGDARPTPGDNRATPPDGSPLGCWDRWCRGDSDGAWVDWRGLLGRGLAGAEHGRGCWDPPSEPPGAAPAAGMLLCGLSHGLLGIRSDAPSGRIRMSPVLPRHVTHFAVEGIRVGEARLSLRYDTDGTTHRYTLEPTRGRVPPMVILEPIVPASVVTASRVDGADADLPTSPVGGSTRLQAQIPLDSRRTVEVDTA